MWSDHDKVLTSFSLELQNENPLGWYHLSAETLFQLNDERYSVVNLSARQQIPFNEIWGLRVRAFAGFASSDTRSEEHTSELQSRGHLVCRLLREKTKNPRWLEERRGSLRGVSHAPQAEGRGSAATGSALQGEGRPGGRLSRARGHSASDLSPTLT